eukprot:scaffold683_cov124-Cylindrotheca_fusiformis.AAC.15
MTLSEGQVAELQRSFHAFDANGSGFIEMDELREGLKRFGYNISEEGIDHLLALVESTDDKIDFEEFIAWNALLWKDEMKTKFQEIDKDNSGSIDKVELKQWAKKMGYGFTETEIDDICYEMDSTGNDKISLDEFINGMAANREGNSYFVINGEIYMEKLKSEFRALDVDNSGYITRSDFRKLAKKAHYKLSKKELDRTMQSMDSNGDGKISFEEFMASVVKMTEDV